MKVLDTYSASKIIELDIKDLNDLLKLKGYQFSLRKLLKIEIQLLNNKIKLEGE